MSVAHGKLEVGRGLAADRWASRGSLAEMHVEILDADFENSTHRAGILEILDSYAASPVGGGEPLSSDVRGRLLPALGDHPTTLVLLAVSEGCPVGVAVCFVGFSTFRARPLLNIHDLAVLPEWQSKGVGRALLAAAEDRAQRRGCCRLTLEVQDDNGRARALYESFGFSDFAVGDLGPTRFLTKALGASMKS